MSVVKQEMKALYNFARNPLSLIGVLWAFVLLAPHLPGLPRPALGGLPWRQELTITALMSLTLALQVKRLWQIEWARINFARAEFHLLLAGAAFVAWMWFSTLWAANAFAAAHQAFQWSAYLIFFVLMRYAVARPRVLRSSLIALGLVVLMLGVASIIESWIGAPMTDGNMRGNAKPVLRSSGGFGEIMALAAPLFAAFALYVRQRRAAFMCGALATLAWLSTIQALQRAPLIGGFCGLALLFGGAWIWSTCRARNPRRYALLLAALIFVTLMQTIPSPLTNHDTATIIRMQNSLEGDRNTQVRLLYWSIGFEMFRAHPFRGVGANNYEIAYPLARTAFSARHPDSDLIKLDEALRVVYAHNEYVQMLAELGLIGFILFACFSALLVRVFWRALRHKRAALPALGAGGGMLAFALSSGASASSFRYLGGSLIFFFAAAIITHIASSADAYSNAYSNACNDEAQTIKPRLTRLSYFTGRTATACALLVMLLMLCSTFAQATNSILSGMAQSSVDLTRTENLYRTSLAFNPANPATQFSYGMWLYANKRALDSLPYLRYAAANGFNSSTCYAYLTTAEEAAGDLIAAERTMRLASDIYPRSVFVRVRHADVLYKLNKSEEAEIELQAALASDERAARGWWQVMRFGLRATGRAARADNRIAAPGELAPEDCVFTVLSEDERRPPAISFN